MKKDVLQGAIAVAACIVLFAMSCAQDRLFVRWQGAVYNKSTQTESFLIWKDGIQYYRILIGDVEVFVSGVADKEYIYFYVKAFNKSQDIINLYPKESTLTQRQDKNDKYYAPLRPRDVRKIRDKRANKLALFAALSMPMYPGLYSSASDKMLYTINKNEANARHAEAQIANTAQASSLIDMLLKDHTFFPSDEYSGYIVYGLERMGGIESDKPFKLSLKIGINRAIIRGILCPRDVNDELDTPEDLRNVQFSVK